LRVAVSNDDGVTWTRVALLELGDNKHYYHYPTMHQDGCRLLVVYSVMQVKETRNLPHGQNRVKPSPPALNLLLSGGVLGDAGAPRAAEAARRGRHHDRGDQPQRAY
jgi:hypothetical protein